ncbi:hypothetical protein C483_10191 [Natrialba hulunbeirensis JCM 10989]|uniref:Uncharacterized protein n=1 Tax=Natrialba hulunbeirensis JCM 10989 TaxID=1227493 RepID=L9ZY93_9EURY|nr:hypothetical protein [Natrialba hulunbeirensis]ELY91046.1 hypothetical protein C483_10191 [Natrialba hulunbeirensis JCM 10989]
MSVEHRSHSRARDRSVVVSFSCDSETAAVAEAATDTDADTDTPTHTDTDTETDATRATRTARTDTQSQLSAQTTSPITARFVGTNATRPTPARLERTRLRAQIATLQTELESRTDQQQELITQYERLLEAQQDAAKGGDEDETTGDSTADSGSVLKRLGTGNGRRRTRVIRIRRRIEQWWRQLRR